MIGHEIGKGKFGKVLRAMMAVLMALVMCVTIAPPQAAYGESAALSVQLPEGSYIANTTQVTLTDSTDGRISEAAFVGANGFATFALTNDGAGSYRLAVVGLNGYEDYKPADTITFDGNGLYTVESLALTIKRYAINAGVTGGGKLLYSVGSIGPGNSSGSFYVEHGSEITIIPDDGYAVQYISVDGRAYFYEDLINDGPWGGGSLCQLRREQSGGKNYYIMTVFGALNIQVAFTKMRTVTVSYEGDGYGSVYYLDGSTNGALLRNGSPIFVRTGASVKLSIRPIDTRYRVAPGSMNINGTDNESGLSLDSGMASYTLDLGSITAADISVRFDLELIPQDNMGQHRIVSNTARLREPYERPRTDAGGEGTEMVYVYDGSNPGVSLELKDGSGYRFIAPHSYDVLFPREKSYPVSHNWLVKQVWYWKDNGYGPPDHAYTYDPPIRFVFDKSGPIFEGDVWYNGGSNVCGYVKDDFDIEKVRYSTKKEEYDGDTLSRNADGERVKEATLYNPNEPGSTWSFGASPEKDGNGNETGKIAETYYIWAYDSLGHKSALKKLSPDSVQTDKTAPIGEILSIVSDPASPGSEFGYYSSDKVKITVSVKDDKGGGAHERASGVREVILRYKDNTIDSISAENFVSGNEATFEISASQLGNEGWAAPDEITIVATDKAGNKISDDKAAKVDKEVVIEDDKPSVSIISRNSSHPYSDEGGREWYAGAESIEWDVAVKDADDDEDIYSGIHSIKARVKGVLEQPKEYVNETFPDKKTRAKTPQITLEQNILAPSSDGTYTISADAKDNAGNDAETATKTIYIDKHKPSIIQFSFEAVGNQDAADEENIVTTADYGYYFREDTRVVVRAQDDMNGNPSAGLKDIVIKAKDINATEAKAVSSTEVNSDGEVSCVIPANFKGTISAQPIDNVGNKGDFVHPHGVIIETGEKHADTSKINLSLHAASGNEGHSYNYTYTGSAMPDKQMDFRPGTLVQLYNVPATVDMMVEDTYSGIREVKWTILEAENEPRVNAITIDNDGLISGDFENTWHVTAGNSSRDENLITSLSFEDFRITADHNDVVLLVELTDRAGNQSYDFQVFGVDNKAPAIAVSYDNNAADSERYFKANRTATITVTERNFDPAKFTANITASGATAPALSSWTSSGGTGNWDDQTHTARILFSDDADYQLDFSAVDRAGNANSAVSWTGTAARAFTIDKVLPTIQVSYDNNAALNENYYSAARTATITVTERNFDPDRVKIDGTATDGGTTVSFPGLRGWGGSGNTHTATIRYDRDARYTFDIAVTDKAGNASLDYESDEFYIDQTDPEIIISNVEDQSANRDQVMPVVTFKDTNFDPNGTEIQLIGANRGESEVLGSRAGASDGQVFSFSDFERTKPVDDLYTLNASMRDKAGNQFEESIQFSVNRFGSVYVFDESLNAILGAYTNESPDVKFREINVDTRVSEKADVRVARNGTTSALSEEDFSESVIQDPGVAVDGGVNGKAPTAWSITSYTIPAPNFGSDGSYEVSVFSIDRAGNENDNAATEKKSEIAFAVDKTPPAIIVSDLESGGSYNETEKIVFADIKDNMKMGAVEVRVNGKLVNTDIQDQYYRFTLPASNTMQDVKIIARDAAGNETLHDVGNFVVTTNVAVRWFYNTPLFIATMIGILAIALFIFLFAVKRRKRNDATEKA